MNELKAWWSSTSMRERRLVIIAAIVLLVGGFYWLIYQPINSQLVQAQQQLKSEQALNTWLVDKANRITTLRKQGAVGTKTSSAPLNQVISQTASRHQVNLIRMQPRGDMVQVWVQPLAFNALVDWLDDLKNNQGLRVLYLDIKASDTSGMVEVERLQLERG